MKPPTAEQLIVIDIGNSRVAMGIWDADGVHDVSRVELIRDDEWRAAFENLRETLGDGGDRAAVVASVNPTFTSRICEAAEVICDVESYRVGTDIELPMPMRVDAPEEVGVDRVCNAAAAFERVQEACAVASFGTAITIDCVSTDGEFLGGAILAGLRMGTQALHETTAQLPDVEPEANTKAFGRNTHDAIGQFAPVAAIGALREIVERYATELGTWPQLIVTGGDAGLIQPQADFVDAVVPDLCLMGAALAYRKAAAPVA